MLKTIFLKKNNNNVFSKKKLNSLLYLNIVFKKKNFFLNTIFKHNKILNFFSKNKIFILFKEVSYFLNYYSFLFKKKHIKLSVNNINYVHLFLENFYFFKNTSLFLKKFNFFFINFNKKKIKSIKKNLKKKIKNNNTYVFF